MFKQIRLLYGFLFRRLIQVCFLVMLFGFSAATAFSVDKEAKPDAAAVEPKKELAVDLGNAVKLEMVLIRPGTFMMGSDKASDNEKPVHKVTLTKPFYMGKYEVTQEQWKLMTGENPSQYKLGKDAAKRPVEQISWDDINKKFLPKLAERLPKGMKVRLPTEAEWEYSCRAGTTGDFAGELDEMGWYSENSEDKTHPVGKKKPNAWGLFDMHGNVWEWCSDLKEDYTADAATDPAGAKSGRNHIGRGGAWPVDSNHCKSAFRDWGLPDFSSPRLGFRLAIDVIEQ